MTCKLTEERYRQYLAALLAGDRRQCGLIVQELCAAGVDVESLYLHLFQRAMYDVGDGWAQHRISVAAEHLATAITERLLTVAHPQIFGGPPRRRSALIACPAGEQHQLGGRMVADFFELRGWRGDFLGANVPGADLVSIVAARKPDVLGLSVSIGFNLPNLLRSLDEIAVTCPDLPILVGGQALRDNPADAIRRYGNVTCVASIDDLDRTIKAYGDG